MKKFLIIIAVLISLAVVAGVSVMFMSSSSRQIAKDFVIHSSTGQYQEAYALFHPALQQEFSIDNFAQFDNVKPYTDVSFVSVEMADGATTLKGSASTEDGCTSQVSFKIIGEQIVSFNINPLCFK